MRKSNRCIKCGSNKITKICDKSRYNNAININAFKVAISTKYVCCECGYFEEYFESEEDLKNIYEKFN